MDWVRKGDWYMQMDNFTITKYIVNGIPKYVLWKDKEWIEMFDSFKEAKEYHARG